MTRLADQVIVVTGAGAGIGRACVGRFVDEGASVVAADRSAKALDSLSELVASGRVDAVEIDVTDDSAADALVAQAISSFGKLDAFHANAGGQFPTPFLDTGDDVYEQVRALNLDAVWSAARAAMAVFVEAGRGSFLATSSGGGSGAVPGLAAYGAAKAGVQALVRSLAVEYGPLGIRSNAISPGPISSPGLLAWVSTLPGGLDDYTAAKPMRRLGDPTEIAAAATFLLSDDASFVNGVTLPVDGGALAALAGQ